MILCYAEIDTQQQCGSNKRNTGGTDPKEKAKEREKDRESKRRGQKQSTLNEKWTV
jgi:hypothetical protein